MNIHKVVNIFCLIMGICVLIFACVVKAGMIDNVLPSKATMPFILGAIIVLWSATSMLRRR